MGGRYERCHCIQISLILLVHLNRQTSTPRPAEEIQVNDQEEQIYDCLGKGKQNKPKKIFNKYLNKLCAIFRNKKQSENTKDSENDHVIDVESVLRKYKRNIEREESLNHLDKKFLIEKRATVTRFFSESYSKNTKEKIKKLSSSSIPKNFSDNYILPFAPVFIKFKILLMLGSYKINKISTDFFLIQNDFRMNEKLNFKNLLVFYFYIRFLIYPEKQDYA